jgi:hypothetical protein
MFSRICIDEVNLVGHWVPNEFTNLACLVFPDAEQIEASYKVIRKQVRFDHTNTETDLKEIALKSIHALIRKVKKGKLSIVH